MRVGLFVDHFDPEKGGMERAVAQLVERLLASGHEAHTYSLSASSGAPGEVHVIDLAGLRRGELERQFAARALAVARDDACDVTLAVRHCPEVDVYWPHGGAHGATLAAGEASKGGAVGAVSRLLHKASPRHRDFLDLERAASTGGAREVWCVSQLVRDEFATAYPGAVGRLVLHPNGVDRGTFHPTLRDVWRTPLRAELGVAEGAPVALFMGGNLRLKGWAVLRAALSSHGHLPWTCVVAGADLDRVRGGARAAGLSERIVALPHRAAVELFGVADLMVQPTYRDPCSLATLEALAAGVPVLTTTANGASDALTNAGAGESVVAGDADAFSDAFGRWIARVADPTARAQASIAARACTVDRSADAWLDGMVSSLVRLAG